MPNKQPIKIKELKAELTKFIEDILDFYGGACDDLIKYSVKIIQTRKARYCCECEYKIPIKSIVLEETGLAREEGIYVRMTLCPYCIVKALEDSYLNCFENKLDN